MSKSSVTVKLNRKGIKDLLTSDGVAADLGTRARRIQAAAIGSMPGGTMDDIKSNVSQDGSRARATVWTSTYDAKEAEAKTRNLTTALEAGRS